MPHLASNRAPKVAAGRQKTHSPNTAMYAPVRRATRAVAGQAEKGGKGAAVAGCRVWLKASLLLSPAVAPAARAAPAAEGSRRAGPTHLQLPPDRR